MSLEEVIKGLECCILRNPDDHARCSQCSYGGNCVNRLKMDALEWLKKLAKCNHDCKIDCLLDAYNKVVAERDELLEKQKPVKPMAIRKNELAYIMPGAVVWYEQRLTEWEDMSLPIYPVCVDGIGEMEWNGRPELLIKYSVGSDPVSQYGLDFRLWTARPTEEQRREEPWEEQTI